MIVPQGNHLLQEDKAPGSLEEGHAPSIYEGALLKSRGRDLPQQNQWGSGILTNSENENDVNGKSLAEKFILESGHQIQNKNKDGTYIHKSIGKWRKWSSKQARTSCGLTAVISHTVRNVCLPLDQKYTKKSLIDNSPLGNNFHQ